MNEKQPFKSSDQNQVNFFAQILQNYLPYWPLFALTITVCLFFAFVNYRAQAPVYVVSAKILIKDPSKSGDSKVLDALNIFGEKKIVENELIVLRSSILLQSVVSELDFYTTIYNEGNVRTEELYGDNSPVKFIAINKDNIAGFGKLYFTMDWDKQRVFINNTYVPFDSTVLLGNTVYRLEVNQFYNKNVINKKYYVQGSSIESVAERIASRLKTNPVSNVSTVIEVKLETEVPEKAEAIIAKLFEIYERNGIDEKNETAKKTLDFIDGRLQLVTAQLDSVENNIQTYRAKESLSENLTDQAKEYLTRITNYDAKGSEIAIQLDVLEQIKNYVTDKGTKPGTVPSLLLNQDPILDKLLGDLYEAEFLLTQSKSITGEKSNEIILEQEKINSLKSDILENISNIRHNLLVEQKDVNDALNLNQSLINQLPEKEKGLLEISRQQAVKNGIYLYLLQKREETALSYASAIADLKIIDNPSISGPISPIAQNYYITGAFFGFLIAIGIVLIKEKFNNKILFRDEVQDKTNMPFAGEIIQAMIKNPIVIYEGRKSIIAEQFRSMRTNLSYLGLDDKHKTVMITSCIPGEGKSFIAINLGISFTLTGKKVVLMEVDLRRPKLSKLLSIDTNKGIANYLVKKATINDIIKETSIPNLYVISAGAIPPNPTELIIKPEFKQMMDEIKARFDIVIIDTAPIVPVTDALLLKDYADLTLFVIRHNRTPKVMIRTINEYYEQKKINNMAFVFNGVKKRGIIVGNIGKTYGSGYGYGYGYGYSYGYGYDTKEERVSLLLKRFLSKIKSLFKK
jgi:capsular exopolysaccharide synthesis family protein